MLNKMSSVCLTMIVKNEEKVIQRCLFSCLPLIDYFVICDTGSTDKTIEKIHSFSEKYGLKGEVHQHEWKNFEHNRNLSLEIAKKKCDYIFWIDADDIIEFADNWKKQLFTNDAYYMNIKYDSIQYKRVHIVKSSLDFKWSGVVHESICVPSGTPVAECIGIDMIIVGGGGGRNLDPEKHKKDAVILENALKTEPTNSRYMFYLAQSYRNCGRYDDAIYWYKKRSEIDSFPEERCYSLYQNGLMKVYIYEKEKRYSDHEALFDFLKAHEIFPHRIEPLYYVVYMLNKNNMFSTAYNLGIKYISTRVPNEKCVLFTEQEIYTSKFPLELACSAANSGKIHEAIIIYLYMIHKSPCSNSFKEIAKGNLQTCLNLLGIKEQLTSRDLPAIFGQTHENSLRDLYYSL